MLHYMKCRVFVTWCRFYRQEPWGFEISFVRTARLCATIMRSVGQECQEDDFMPDCNRPRATTLGGPKKSVEQMTNMILFAANQIQPIAR